MNIGQMLGVANELEREVRQQERLINRDFPWLWAVQSSWLPGFHRVGVSNDTFRLREFLEQPALKHLKMWVQLKSGNLVEVRQVKHLPNYRACWARRIIEVVGTGRIIEHIVVAYHIYQTGGEKQFTIYRPPRGAAYNFFIQLALETARLTEDGNYLKAVNLRVIPR